MDPKLPLLRKGGWLLRQVSDQVKGDLVRMSNRVERSGKKSQRSDPMNGDAKLGGDRPYNEVIN